MTRHTHITSRYVPQTGDDAAIQLNAFLDRLTARLSRVSGTLTAQTLRRIVLEAQGWHSPNDPKLAAGGPGIPCGGMTVNYVDISTDHWSPWLEWRGGPCPLPGDAVFQLHGLHTLFHGACLGNWDNIRRFRYRADNPAGWLPRGDWIPPDELWDEGCPVRCEWTPQYIPSDDDHPSRWDHVTHIRLVARQPQAGLPAGWSIENGSLYSPGGNAAMCLPAESLRRFAPAAIRQAVDAWLREMGDE